MTSRRLRSILPPVDLRSLERLPECVDCARVQIARWILGEPKVPQVCSHGAPAAEVVVPRGGEVLETRSA